MFLRNIVRQLDGSDSIQAPFLTSSLRAETELRRKRQLEAEERERQVRKEREALDRELELREKRRHVWG